MHFIPLTAGMEMVGRHVIYLLLLPYNTGPNQHVPTASGNTAMKSAMIFIIIIIIKMIFVILTKLNHQLKMYP